MERIPSEILESVLDEMLSSDPTIIAPHAKALDSFIAEHANSPMLAKLERVAVQAVMSGGPDYLLSSLIFAILAGQRMEAARLETASLEALFRA